MQSTFKQMLGKGVMAEGSNEVCIRKVSPLCQCLE